MTDLRKAAQAVLDAWDSPLWKTGTTAAKIADLRTALEQQAEPVAWMRPSEDGYDSAFRDHSTVVMCTGNPWTGWVPLYTTPPQRQWVGLTDEDLEFWTGELGQGELGRGVIRAVVDHLKEKNND